MCLPPCACEAVGGRVGQACMTDDSSLSTISPLKNSVANMAEKRPLARRARSSGLAECPAAAWSSAAKRALAAALAAK